MITLRIPRLWLPYISGRVLLLKRMYAPLLFRGCWARSPEKIHDIRIDALLSRQPLVKGERLVRFEVSAAMVVAETAGPGTLCYQKRENPIWAPKCKNLGGRSSPLPPRVGCSIVDILLPRRAAVPL